MGEVKGDLISRNAVIDVLKETGIIQDNDLGHLVVEEINRIPTAYDVEKVAEDLEKISTVYSLTPCTLAIERGIALHIVRNGGK